MYLLLVNIGGIIGGVIEGVIVIIVIIVIIGALVSLVNIYGFSVMAAMYFLVSQTHVSSW